MKTKEQITAELKSENPILQRGSDETGYEEITGAEYNEVINSWAEAAYAKELEAQQATEATAKRQALLDKLGITEDEARLLLGGN